MNTPRGVRQTMADALRARGKLGPYGPTEEDPPDPPPPRPSEDPAAVRAWAAANNIEVGKRGLLPAVVLQRYREAHDGAVDLS